MGYKKLKEKAEQSDSKGSNSQRKEEQLEAYARSTACQFQNGEGK